MTIKGVYGKRKAKEVVLEGVLQTDTTDLETISFLKRKVILNQNDRNIVNSRMEKIHVNRYVWIQNMAPSITEILDRYPRYKD